MLREENLDEVFDYHAPEPGDLARYQAIRDAAKALAHAILTNVPSVGADQQAALRKVREAMMTANAAIATKGAA